MSAAPGNAGKRRASTAPTHKCANSLATSGRTVPRGARCGAGSRPQCHAAVAGREPYVSAEGVWQPTIAGASRTRELSSMAATMNRAKSTRRVRLLPRIGADDLVPAIQGVLHHVSPELSGGSHDAHLHRDLETCEPRTRHSIRRMRTNAIESVHPLPRCARHAPQPTQVALAP